MKIKWSRMYWIIVFCTIFHLVGSFISLCIAYAAFYIFNKMGHQLNIVTSPNEGIILPAVLGTIGGVSFLLEFPQAIMVIRSMQRRYQKHLNRCLTIMLFLHFIWSLVVLVVAIAIYLHSYNIHDRMNDGLLEAMNKYQNDPILKNIIDEVQFEFQCCGSLSYKDWFNIRWHDDNYMTKTQTEELHDDVPFSCCSIKVLAPCIHYGVIGGREDVEYLYSPDRNLTITTNGCHEALAKRAKTLAWLVAVTIAIYAVIQIFTSLLTRIIQTGHSTFMRFNRRYPINCWLLPYSSSKKSPKDKEKNGKNKNTAITQLKANSTNNSKTDADVSENTE